MIPSKLLQIYHKYFDYFSLIFRCQLFSFNNYLRPIKIYILMEPQEDYTQQIHNIYTERSPQATKQIHQILKEGHKNTQKLRQFMNDLISSKIHSINFHNWGNIARMLIKSIKAKKDKQLELMLGKYFVQSAQYFYPYLITRHNYHKLKPFLTLCRGIIIPKPESSTNQIHNILCLQTQYDDKWANGLIQTINTTVLVDRKNQPAKSLKMNPFYGPFVVAHFQKFQPQLERLLVRSQANIEIWVQFFQAIKDICGLEKYVINLLKKNKNSFLTNKDIAIRLVNALTSCMKDEKYFYECFQYIKGLISSQHNAKKKIIYFQMLRGLIESAKRYNHNSKIVNEVLILVINSWAKFGQEEEANIVLSFLELLLPIVKEPVDEIASICKASVKSQNKYIQLFLNLVLSEVFNKQSYFEELPSVKEIFGMMKAQLPNFLKKVEANWHWLLCLINFLSHNDLSFAENSAQIKFLFRDSCLALNNCLKKCAIKLLVQHILYLRREAEDENHQINSEICLSLCVLMEEVHRQSWEEYLKLNENEKNQIILKGLFPLIYFKCEKTQKNKGYRFISLGQFLLKHLKEKKPWQTIEKYATICGMVHYPIERIIEKKKELSLEEEELISKLSKNYLKMIIFDFENNEKNLITDHERLIIRKTVGTLNSYAYPTYLDELLSKFLNPDYYTKDRDFISLVEEESIEAICQHNKNFENQKQELKEKGYYVEPKFQQKKQYLGQMLDVKMMSEDEVKEEKYRQHFDKMLHYFGKLVDMILRSINEPNFIEHIWEINFNSLIHIVRFPDHRNYIFRIVKYSCELIGSNAKQWKIFKKYSNFFGQFFAIRGAYITPSVKLMEKCHSFLKIFLDMNISQLKGSMLLLINDMCEYLIDNMEFDVNLKRFALKFYSMSIEQKLFFNNSERLYGYLVKNLNIISSSGEVEVVLGWCLERIDSHRYGEMFVDILNYITITKQLILSLLTSLENKVYEPQFQDYIKLRILSLESNQSISKMANQLLSNDKSQAKEITKFNMSDFIKKNSKQTIQRLCQFVTESINPNNIDDAFKLVIKAADQLYDDKFDQEGLQFFPYFLSLNIQNIPIHFLKPIFELLIMKYTNNEDYPTLSRMSVDIGIDIIKKYAKKQGEKLLLIIQGFLNKAKGISNIVFLGVLAPFIKGNKNIQLIQQRIKDLFKGNNQAQQRDIAKCMPDLMSFFKEPQKIIETIFSNMSGLQQKLQTGQSYLAAGLLKGVGSTKTVQYLQMMINADYPSKKKPEKSGRCWLLHAFIDNFGRVVELRVIQIIQILIQYMSDSNEDIRDLSKKVVQTFVPKMSSFAVKNLLPHLLSGLQNQQNWRVKISYIWILGIMANCSAKQLQASLPIIVPTLSVCLSNAHPTIRDKAAEALSLIGETIKNPQISNSIDILIEALQNPFEKSNKAIDALLKMRFSHYIDPPSLSIIIPIVDYSLRGRVSELKEGACQVIGSVCELIQNPSDMLPYLKIISTGLKMAICDPLAEIRSIAAMAIGRISSKIGADDAQKYFNFVLELIQSANSNTTQKSGAAQSYAEMICSQDYGYFEESLNVIFDKLNEVKHIQKQGYLLVFLYVPAIRKDEFQGFIKEVNENMYIFVSDDDENLRNSAMQVAKVLINSYSLTHTDLLLEPLCEGVFESNWRKRNSALTLIGEMLNIIKSYMFHTKNSDKTYAYYRGLMAVYILKDDELQMPRMTAHQVWNAYIQNTPKTIKSGLETLVQMWTRFTHSANGIVFRNIVGFSGKYGENYFLQILQHLEELSSHPLHKKGVFQVLGEFIKRLSQQYLSKESLKTEVRTFYQSQLFKVGDEVRESLARSLALFVEKLHDEEYFEGLIYPHIDKMEKLNEEEPQYIDMLHLMRDLLHTSSNRVANRLINKIMEPPLSEFKIQVITNNADKVANNLYTLFGKKPATQSMLGQIFTLLEVPEKQNRLSLLTYCLNQISVRLNSNFKTEYIKMLITNIRAYSHKENNNKAINKLFQMVLFFLNAISLSQIESLEELIGEVAPFIFKGLQSIKENAHKIFLILISDPKGKQTGLYYRQLIVTLENNRGKDNIWKDEETVKNYITILVKGLAYGNNDIMEDSLEMLKFIINFTDKPIISRQIMRIVGPVIRVANYPLQHRQKQKLLQFLQAIFKSEFNMEIYNHQIISVCMRLLSQYRNNKRLDELIKLISSTLFCVLVKSEKHAMIMKNLVQKIKVFGEPLVRTLYYLFKMIINEKSSLLATPTYENANQQLQSLLGHNQCHLSVKALYYVSKTSARIGSHLKIPIEKYEAQIEGVTCSYQMMLNYLHHAYYTESSVPKLKRLQLFIQESTKDKAYYLLKSLKLCRKKNARTKALYSHDYVGKMIPQTLIGFDDIAEVLQDFE